MTTPEYPDEGSVPVTTAVTRRQLLRLAGLAGGAVLAGTLAGCNDSGSTAQGVNVTRPPKRDTSVRPVGSAPPVVDRVAVWVLVDNAHDIFAKSVKLGDLNVERNGLGLGQRLNTQLQSEFGLALHLESQRNTETRVYLLDYGLTPTSALNNVDFLKIDLAAVDALILSHGHYDHFGGLIPLLSRERNRMRDDLPLYVGGEDAFCYRWFTPPSGGRQAFGVLDRRQLAGAGVRVVMAQTPTVMAGQAFTTGAIPRTTFEKIQPAARIELGMRDGAGCDASHFTAAEQAGQIVPDQFWFEHATCFNVRDRGLVVISSCGHGGIINSVKQAQVASGVEKVHAVMGGFHLAPAPEPYVDQVVAALKEINPDYVVPMHCSGATFARLAEQAMPGRVIASSTGTRFTFGSA
jgi:7,8-dihydropterin-6-yl-methyl-4-(beta-D-ribofuranosyl)aminobenzene 5'-phosphate synthase